MENHILKEHYYGDAVRTIFIIAGIIMIATFPLFSSLILMPIMLSIISILILAVFAGFLNPKQLWTIILNAFVSIVAFTIFEYYAVHTYISPAANSQLSVSFFWINQFLTLMFFIATYLSVKSLRGKLLAGK